MNGTKKRKPISDLKLNKHHLHPHDRHCTLTMIVLIQSRF